MDIRDFESITSNKLALLLDISLSKANKLIGVQFSHSGVMDKGIKILVNSKGKFVGFKLDDYKVLDLDEIRQHPTLCRLASIKWMEDYPEGSIEYLEGRFVYNK